MTAGNTVGEPLDVHDVGTKAERRERVRELLSTVGPQPGLRRSATRTSSRAASGSASASPGRSRSTRT